MLQDEASQAGDDRESLFEATFILMSEELGELVEALVEALGGLEDSQAQPAASSPAPAPAPQTAPADSGGAVDVPWD
ncbi:recombination associated protein [Chromobacterium violaceum]|nr:recombination associated protein [Chromobacterium violaceum]